MKAEQLLQKSSSIDSRAKEYVTSIKRNIQKKVIDKLTEAIEKIDDELFENLDFSLETNVNSGQTAITRSEAERRFTAIINLEHDKELLTRELQIKYKSFNKYFLEDEDAEEKVTITT